MQKSFEYTNRTIYFVVRFLSMVFYLWADEFQLNYLVGQQFSIYLQCFTYWPKKYCLPIDFFFVSSCYLFSSSSTTSSSSFECAIWFNSHASWARSSSIHSIVYLYTTMSEANIPKKSMKKNNYTNNFFCADFISLPWNMQTRYRSKWEKKKRTKRRKKWRLCHHFSCYLLWAFWENWLKQCG